VWARGGHERVGRGDIRHVVPQEAAPIAQENGGFPRCFHKFGLRTGSGASAGGGRVRWEAAAPGDGRYLVAATTRPRRAGTDARRRSVLIARRRRLPRGVDAHGPISKIPCDGGRER